MFDLPGGMSDEKKRPLTGPTYRGRFPTQAVLTKLSEIRVVGQLNSGATKLSITPTPFCGKWPASSSAMLDRC